MKLIEVRTYRLKPGCAERFTTAVKQALPLVQASGMDVVAFGRSDHEEESFFLIRAFDSREQLTAQQDAFYGSTIWREGPRQTLVDCLETYLNTLLWLPQEAVDALRANHRL
ncbi:NIPSNAP family protein [Roseateles sp. BYS87W]|uniref:NIPSNAP family protein n=1 Tax=Pelomonas baiyunensis TaxID=3299026 RepID=A0ABW7GV52_9BURK